MIYAPVIITTLNRYNHFKKCLESLEKCTDADKTDVFVALDYPPTEKFVEGWRQIDAYLQQKEHANGFHSLTVYRRETNYFYTEKGNLHTAIEDATHDRDRYIIIEDDCEMSPNFLDYINQGLERYQDDPTVYAISAYSPSYPFIHGDSTIIRHNVDFYAWAFGVWKNKNQAAWKFICENHFYDTFSWANARTLWRNSRHRYCTYLMVSNRKKPLVSYDNTISLYMGVSHLDVIMPVRTLVRNHGWDGSGAHGNNAALNEAHKMQTIDTGEHFEYRGTGMEGYTENRKLFRANNQFVTTTWLQVIKTTIWFIISRAIHKIR